MQKDEALLDCGVCFWRKHQLPAVLATWHRKCVALNAHAELGKAVMLACRVPMYL